MIAVQRPLALFSPPSSFAGKPSHARNPSAPVVVRPTHTPGLLSLSKPAQQPLSRPQQAQPYARAPRSSAKGKSHQRSSQQQQPALARPVEDAKKSSDPKPQTDSSLPKAAKSATHSPATEKSVRGRQPNKQVTKDKADLRTPSVTSSRSHARRIVHQPSPSPTRAPQQADEISTTPVNPFRAQMSKHHGSDSNHFDPFVVSSSDNESDSTPSPSKAGDKPAPIHTPALASRPTGKLARRRQGGAQSTGFSVPTKAVPVPRSNGNNHSHIQLARSEPALPLSETPRRPARRLAPGLPVADWDEFPVSDETLFSPPSTPVRPSASVGRNTSVTWQQQSIFHDGPRTAPLSSSFTFPFAPAVPCVTPSPTHRRRHHRVPSEGVFAMSTDEESSTDSSDELKKAMNAMLPFNKRPVMGGPRTPSPPAQESPAGFYAGSIFQNSPSPDDLPVPAFKV